MKLLKSPSLISTPNPNNLTTIRPTRHNIRTKVSIKPPPPEFDFRTQILTGSRALIAESHPELLDLADEGSLVVIRKSQFGPVPAWRADFVEPECIWLVGTNHVSEKSAGDVERVVQAVRPDNVVVELCRSRAGIMYTSTDDTEAGPMLKSNPFSLSGSGLFGAVGRSINLGGQTALALRLLLATFSSKISSNINRPFGDEFRAARKASEEISAQVVLGDRPIEITLERAWNSLNWNEKLSLITSVLRGITSADQSKIDFKESTADQDTDFQLYEQLSFSYPSLLQPLIHERDTYIAWSLKRSKAVRNSKRVVGVIGRGHLNGVIYALISDLGDLRFRDLTGERRSTGGSLVETIVKSLVRDTIIGVVIWALYEQLKN
ncbi:putative TraB/PrgY/GumN family protein [Helianthus annuus]|nr:putative TraB/PrgY/GumN family protein [Helianthus annuus]